MKKVMVAFIAFFFLSLPATDALTWIAFFVVWEGNVYEITEEQVPASEIRERIGEVNSEANDMTGDYYGNASNYFPVGTDYFAIDGVSTVDAVTVEVEEGQ